MNKNNLTRKSELAEQLGMKFEEASELFSDETLESMRMVNVVGGTDTEDKFYCGKCNNCKQCDNCSKCDCPKNDCPTPIEVKGYVCVGETAKDSTCSTPPITTDPIVDDDDDDAETTPPDETVVSDTTKIG